MQVAVVGSWRDSDRKKWGISGSQGEFELACQKIGAELIRRGHRLVIGSDAGITADFHAVKGALAALGNETPRAPRILLMKPANGKQAFRDQRQALKGIFTERTVQAPSWISAKVFQINFADRVVVVAGAQNTHQAGLTAAVSKKRLACIGSFGGAAERLNTLVSSVPGDVGVCTFPK